MKTKIDYSILGPQITLLAKENLTAKEISIRLNVERNVIDKFVKKESIHIKDGRGATYRKETFPCVICGNHFNVKKSVYEAGSKTTCSKVCSSIARSQANPKYAKVTKSCLQCNKSFLIKPSKFETAKFCSRVCMDKNRAILMATFTCVSCRNTFSAPASSDRKYCSSECWNGWTVKPTVECKMCKKTFIAKASEDRVFCSRACHDESQKLIHKRPEITQKVREMVAQNQTYMDIAKALGYMDDSAISRIVADNDIAIKYIRNKSRQEMAIIRTIEMITGEKAESASTYPGSRFVYDAKFSFGYIEYDGRGGHYRSDQLMRDDEKSALVLDLPIIRINPQAYHGGEAYLRWKLKNEISGYCFKNNYQVSLVTTPQDHITCREILRDCHPLSVGAGKIQIALKYGNQIIGVAKFGASADKNETRLELKRFFVLDGTSKNTESYFLSKCTELLKFLEYKEIITYCHEWEKGSYLTATGWKEVERTHREYEFYSWKGRIFSQRVWWKWAKESGLVDQAGGPAAKLALAEILGAKVIYEGTKRKFVKKL